MDDLMDSLKCPISKKVMFDPVVLAGTGLSYERDCIRAHLRASNTDPETGRVLDAKEQRLLPNPAMKALIWGVLRAHRDAVVAAAEAAKKKRHCAVTK